MTQNAYRWRTLLGEIIRDPQEKVRLAEAMGVNAITLVRWVNTGWRSRTPGEGGNGDKPPRPQKDSLRRLVAALPQYREQLLPSLLEEFQELTEEDFLLRAVSGPAEGPMSLPVGCYEDVLQAAATLSGELRFTTIFDHLLDYAIQQLDPERLGLCVSVIQCTRPLRGHNVRSLRELFRQGTPPWPREREERNLYYGAESLAGHAVATCRLYKIEDLRSYTGWLPKQRVNDEVSVAACPIQRAGQVAGCLLLTSTQAGYFHRGRLRLLQHYGYLAQMAFEQNDFYEVQDIELRLMPDACTQEPYLRLFHKQVEEVLAYGEIITWEQAALQVMHQIEEKLIAAPFERGSTSLES
jgi:hypothetical protein